jgi:uncharacterized protein YndB with AHSA1/START domain
MTTSTKTVEIKLERTIPAPPSEVFDAWLDPKIPGTPWHEHEKLIVNPQVDGLWCWLSVRGTAHYGRFMEIDRPGRIQHTWVSRNTVKLGTSSKITRAHPCGRSAIVTLDITNARRYYKFP